MQASSRKLAAFRKTILGYYRKHGRDLQWRHTITPYRVVVSEIMLQQTQVERVALKYPVFIKTFPSFAALAKASVAEVLRAWQGLGYNRRALALKKIAELVVRDYKGKLPSNPHELEKMPGIGRATAGSIAAFGFNKPVVFIETNIRRVFIHFFFAKTKKKVHDDDIMPLAKAALHRKNPRAWYSALMDYGTMLAKKVENPNRRSVHHVKQSKFDGSDRQVRGKILKLLIARNSARIPYLARELREPTVRVRKIADGLAKDKLISLRKGILCISI